MDLSIVLPAYNEELNINIIYDKIITTLNINKISTYEIIFVDDGSTDCTLSKIKALRNINKKVKYLSFSKNFGHQSALHAGLEISKYDCVITMDCDLQHPPELITDLINKHKDGYDIVNTIRKDDNTPFFKRYTSKIFYQFINFFSDYEVKQGAADFRLLSRKVLLEYLKFKERTLFLRGIVPQLGFKQAEIEYIPNKRLHGETKYSLSKMITLALSGITSLSMKPLHVSFFLGTIIAGSSFIYLCYVLSISLFTNRTVPGWSSIILSILFIGGIQLIMMGVLGEYVGKILLETKNRPIYILKDSNIDD
jgi:polyisoprenyl-phosphate glycosyltransferase